LSARTLTVYTYESFVSKWWPGPKVTAVFEEQCGCTLNLVGLDDVVRILARLRLEGTHFKADIPLGLDRSMLHEAAATGLFEPHGLDLSRLIIPGGWKNPISAPFDHGYFAFFDEEWVVGVYVTSLLFSDTPPPEIAGYMFRPAKQCLGAGTRLAISRRGHSVRLSMAAGSWNNLPNR